MTKAKLSDTRKEENLLQVFFSNQEENCSKTALKLPYLVFFLYIYQPFFFNYQSLLDALHF